MICITINRKRDELTEELLAKGAVLVRNAISPDVNALLVQESNALDYVEQPKKYGRRGVGQEVSSCFIQPGSRLWDVADVIQRKCNSFFGPRAFTPPLGFNHRNVQHYLDGTLGIEPHQDEPKNRNMVVLVNLCGSGLFRTYKCLGGPVLAEFVTEPRSIVLLLAPGFCGNTWQPPHDISQIRGDRKVQGLRQVVEPRPNTEATLAGGAE